MTAYYNNFRIANDSIEGQKVAFKKVNTARVV